MVADVSPSGEPLEQSTVRRRRHGPAATSLVVGRVGAPERYIRPPTSDHPDPGLFLFEALPGMTDYPATTRAAVIWMGFYHEAACCGFPDAMTGGGHEVLYFADDGQGSPWNHYRQFAFGVYDVGQGPGTDFFRWADADLTDGFTEYVVLQGNLTVDPGS